MLAVAVTHESIMVESQIHPQSVLDLVYSTSGWDTTASGTDWLK
jgi:hypothetical protein